jgi:flagellar protein FlbD
MNGRTETTPVPGSGDGSQPSRQGVYSAVAGALFVINHAGGRSTMIQLTRLNGQPFIINAEKIRYVEQTPDTVICCDTGEKLMVRETLAEVTKRAIDYARLVRQPFRN